jgi:hypothetical protein
MSTYGQKDHQEPALKGIMTDQTLTPPPATGKGRSRNGILKTLFSYLTGTKAKQPEKRTETSENKRPASTPTGTAFRHHNKPRNGRDQRGGRGNRKPGNRTGDRRPQGDRKPQNANRDHPVATAADKRPQHDHHPATPATNSPQQQHQSERVEHETRPNTAPVAHTQQTPATTEYPPARDYNQEREPAPAHHSHQDVAAATTNTQTAAHVQNDTVILLGPPSDHQPQPAIGADGKPIANQDRKPRYPSNQRRRKRFSKNSRHRRPQTAANSTGEAPAPRQAMEGEDIYNAGKKSGSEE